MSGKLAVLFAATGGAHALAARQAGCSFTAHTEGNVTYPLSQHASGQSRAGSTMTPSVFTLNATGLTDAQGRGCWWTPPTTVLQCDVGQVPETGFEIGCDGLISFNGQTTFYECDTADGDQVNIYKLPGQAAANCGEITLVAEACQDCSGDSSSASQSYTASGTSGKTSVVNSATGYSTASQPPAGSSVKTSAVGSSTPVTSYPAGTESGSSPTGSAETPGTQITSTITSTSMITITSCGPEVTDCPDVTVTEYAATETQYDCGDMDCSLVSTPTIQTTPVQSTPVVETTPAVETTPVSSKYSASSEQSVPGYSASGSSAKTPSTTPVAETQSVPQYPTSSSESSEIASTPVVPVGSSQSTVSVPVYSTGKASSSVQSSHVTVPSQSTVPVAESSSTSQHGTTTSPSTVPVAESSTPQQGTTIDVDVTTTVPCTTSSGAISTPETSAVYSTTPVVPVESSQSIGSTTYLQSTLSKTSTVTVPKYTTGVSSIESSETVPVYSTSEVSSVKSSQTTVPVAESSTSQQGTTIDVDQTTTVPCTTTSGAVTTPQTSAVYSTTPTEGSGSTSTIQSVYVPSPSTVNIPESCPGTVTNAGEFNLPHLIIVTDSSSPDTANGTGYFGDITPTRSTIFNFDIETKDAGKTCNLVFLFPTRDTLETSDFTFSGSGALDFSKLTTYATQETSYNNAPSVESDLGQFTVSPGNAYNISSFECPSGSTIAFEMADVSGGDTELWFFQDYNPCPLGLFITTS
ncbi:hypothetical protein PFICI_14831 [Pestalotiopsis fici W106-1]|uniref:Uncharacterized protein n=1 Tax=Pestalotiopsis fici (strain W106-1 / CGMCC3.15140) TaxID=1229662 RepID=W3WIX9_PESFW|nr:uncharacterized protein PFICI_14831 [Pestalotiopsis fici W106-1]ETS73885.1 hypothetical protein PFICI_14831 [Pestalotiopsis fici W106-1]